MLYTSLSQPAIHESKFPEFDFSTSRFILKMTALFIFFLIFLISTSNAFAATYTVNSTADGAATTCTVATCTLRSALAAANFNIAADTINFSVASGSVITLTQTQGQLVISSNVTINGSGARNLTINGGGTDRVFLIATPVLGGNIIANISGLTVTNGNAVVLNNLAGDGGGILNGALLGIVSGTSTLNLTEVTVTGNTATTLGGGIATLLNAVTNINGSTISNNFSNAVVPALGGDVGGGGISNVAATTTIANSTISGNRTLAAGGGILNAAGVVNLTNDTISNNNSTVAGGGVVSVAGVITPILGTTNLRNTIIAQNNSLAATNILGRDVVGVVGSFNSLGNNLIGSNLGAEANFTASAFVGITPVPNPQLDLVGGVAAGNQIIDPLLGLLKNNGGPTDTRLLFTGSPAIDSGNNCVVTNTCATNPQNNNPQTALTLEQRGTGFPRLAGVAVNIGATEGIDTVAPIIVNSLLDNENNGCGVGVCTLREALNDANETTPADTITFQPGLTGTIILTNGQLVADSNLTINGPGARNLTVSGNNTNRVFLVATPPLGGDTTVNINGLSIRNGNAQPAVIGTTLIGDGGGILNGGLLGVLSGTSTLNLTEVTVANNQATTLGGGVATRLNANTNITRSTINNNTSNAALPNGIPAGDVGGGGISNVASTTTVNNSTISNNNSLAAGGGILNAAGVVNLTNDTISNNNSTVAGGGVVSVVGVITPTLGVTNVRNTIIANNRDLLATNVLGRDVVGVAGSFNSLGNNLIGSNFGAEANFTASTVVGVNATPNVNGDIIGNVTVGNQVIDPMLGALQNNGGQNNTRLPLTGSPALERGSNCVLTNTCTPNPQGNTPPTALTIEERGAGYPRQVGANVDIGAVEGLAPTAAAVSISGRVLINKGRGVSRATIIMTDAIGKVRSTMTNSFGYYHFDAVDGGSTFILEVKHKQYSFDSQIVTPTEDLTNINFIGYFSDLKSDLPF